MKYEELLKIMEIEKILNKLSACLGLYADECYNYANQNQLPDFNDDLQLSILQSEIDEKNKELFKAIKGVNSNVLDTYNVTRESHYTRLSDTHQVNATRTCMRLAKELKKSEENEKSISK
ncbi:MAG: hypothetical protein ACI4R8_00505 [Candidatus Caccovivens sp.]